MLFVKRTLAFMISYIGELGGGRHRVHKKLNNSLLQYPACRFMVNHKNLDVPYSNIFCAAKHSADSWPGFQWQRGWEIEKVK